MEMIPPKLYRVCYSGLLLNELHEGDSTEQTKRMSCFEMAKSKTATIKKAAIDLAGTSGFVTRKQVCATKIAVLMPSCTRGE